MMSLSSIAPSVADALADNGIIVLPGFLDEATVTALRGAAQRLQAEGLFHQASIGHKQTSLVDTRIRGDEILWLRDIPEAQTPLPVRALAETADQLVAFLNESLYAGIRSHELHFALYPAGAGYQRHLDVFRDDSARVITFICYLNPPDWTAEDGGQLRIFRPQGSDLAWPFPADTHDVLPAGGTLILFRSALFPHEVLPSFRQRASVTGWFRRD